MRLSYHLLFFALLNLFWQQSSNAQDPEIDSLKNVLRIAGDDANKVKALIRLGIILQDSNPDTALYFHTKARVLAEKIGDELQKGEAIRQMGRDMTNAGNFKKALELLNEALAVFDHQKERKKFLGQKGRIFGDIGIVYDYRADYSKALDYYSRALAIARELGDKNKIAANLINVGLVYQEQGDYPKALNVYFEGLKIAEEINHKQWIANALDNIGIVYKEQADYPKALEYFFKSKKMFEELGSNAIAGNLGDIGLVYGAQGKYTEALEYFFRALNLFNEFGDKRAVALTEGNIGLSYFGINNYPKALEHYSAALEIDREIGNKNGEALHLSNIGQLYVKMRKHREARDYLKQSLSLCRELGTLSYQKDVEIYWTELDSATGNFKGALEHYKNYIAVRDSISNEENTKKQTRAEMQFEFDKKEAATKAEQDKKDAVAAADKKRQRIILFSVAALGLLILGFALFAYRSFLQKKKANEEISKQKELIEEKQKEILDSIYYARRIQRSLMPTEKYIARKLAAPRKPLTLRAIG